jgi:hypothetical protein
VEELARRKRERGAEKRWKVCCSEAVVGGYEFVGYDCVAEGGEVALRYNGLYFFPFFPILK